jgi:hypothetical protein
MPSQKKGKRSRAVDGYLAADLHGLNTEKTMIRNLANAKTAPVVAFVKAAFIKVMALSVSNPRQSVARNDLSFRSSTTSCTL